MRLIDLSPEFLKRDSDTRFHMVDSIAEADGVMFLCPKCFTEHQGAAGTHVVICWCPSVPQSTHPVPGRWNLIGNGMGDLSLVAGSSSVLLTSGCMWHGFVRNGEVTNA